MDKIRLGDIATLINGDRGKNYPSQADITDEGDIPFVNAGHLNGRSIDFEEMNYISQDKFNRLSSGKFVKGDVLYCLRGSLGKKAIINDDVEGAIASSLVIIRPDYNRIDGDYLLFSLDSPSIKEQLIKANNGSSQPNLSAASVREYQIELPEMKVQKDVVNKLAKVRTIIDSRQHEIDLLDELIKARFVEIMNGVSIHNCLGDYIETFSAKRCGNQSLPILSITKADGIVLQGEKFKKRIASSDAAAYKVVPKGKLVQGIHIDERNFAIQNIVDEGIVSPAYKIWTVSPKAIPEVVAYALRTDYAMAYIRSKFTGSIKRRESISKEDLLNFPINLPDLEKQKIFYDFLIQIDKSKVAVQKALEETQLLFDSLMQEYFD